MKITLYTLYMNVRGVLQKYILPSFGKGLGMGLFLILTSLCITQTKAQDLMARQAPIDVKLRAVDSVSLHRLISEEMLEDPSGELYQDWTNAFVNYNRALPAEYKIDLRQFCMPTDSRVVSSHYGYRKQFKRNHYGTDIKGYMGDTIRAAFGGKVRVVTDQGYRKGYGKYVIIRHANGLETIYGHMSKHIAEVNQIVKAGDPIGLVGSTGRSTGPHLHFETRLLGEKIDPELMFDFEKGDVRGDFYIFRRNGRSQLMAAHDAEQLQEQPVDVVEAKAEESRQFQQEKIASRSTQRSKMYKVRQGDTLSKIARKYGISVDRLCKLNHISKSKILKPGQILKCS